MRATRVALLVLGLSTYRIAVAGAAGPDLTGLAAAYLESRAATMQETARPADVEKVLSYCAPSLVYEHPRARMKIEGVETIRAGMIRFLGSSRNASITIGTRLVPLRDFNWPRGQLTRRD